MILDKQAIFSDGQKVKTSAVSTYTIDLGVTGTPRGSKTAIKRDVGQGSKVPLLIQVTQTFAGVTDLTVELECADTEAFTTPKKLFSQKLTGAELIAGARWALPALPYGDAKRYLRLNYVVAGAGTAGAVTAGITMGNDDTLPY